MAGRGADWKALRAVAAGELILAGEERMVLANKQFARSLPLAVPEALLRCADADDVRRALDFVREREIPFAVRSGGHCFGDLSSSPGLVIDLSAMNSIEPAGEAATIGPGLISSEASRALAATGRGLPTGGCPLVGLGGLALCGGFGFLGRRHGLVADRVSEMDVVLADGSLVRASAGEAADLFWALRGGGGLGFGIVTSLTVETHPLEPLTVLNGQWPLAEAPSLIEAWQEWAPEASRAVNLEIGLVCPDFLDEPAFVELFGIVLGEPDAAAGPIAEVQRLLGPLAGGLRGWHLSPADGADYCVGLLNHQAATAWIPKRPYVDVGFQATRSHFFDSPLGTAAIAELVRRFDEDRRHAQYRELELVPWGGAYAQDDGTACFLHRAASILIRHTATAGARSAPELRAEAAAWADRSAAAVVRESNGRSYQGYAEPERPDWPRACHGPRLDRLRDIQRLYDPDGLFAGPGA
jgi:FAD/FMN-containing dehydrogenase